MSAILFLTSIITTTTFLTCFNFNSKFPLFAKKSLIFNNLKINEIDLYAFIW